MLPELKKKLFAVECEPSYGTCYGCVCTINKNNNYPPKYFPQNHREHSPIQWVFFRTKIMKRTREGLLVLIVRPYMYYSMVCQSVKCTRIIQHTPQIYVSLKRN